MFSKLNARNVVILTLEGAHAWLDRNYSILPGFSMDSSVRYTSGIDAFTKHFAKALRNQLNWHTALRSSLTSLFELTASDST